MAGSAFHPKFANTVKVIYHMGITERRIRQKEEVRAAILKSGWNLVIEEGWQSLSIRKIADAIEYSVPVIYDHFENKDAILNEFIKEGFSLLSKDLQAAKDTLADPEEQLKAIGETYWNFAMNNKEYYQLMYGLGMPTCETVKKFVGIQTLTSIIQSTIQDYIIRKSNNPDTNAFLKLHTFWSILHGLVSIRLIGGSTASDAMNQMVREDAVASFIKAL